MDVEFLRYQFENGYYGVITKSEFKIGVRHIQMIYMLMTSLVFGFIRGSLSMAVMAITVDQRKSANSESTHIEIHNWDERIQGAVLSSFFFGYAVMLIPAELYLKRIGGKWLMTLILIVNGALAAAMPTIVNKGGWIAVCNAKLIMGLSHGCLFTVNRSLISHWLPPNERKFFNFFVYGGVQVGIIVGLAVSGILARERLGWELVYYTWSMMALSMAVITFALTASTPNDHEAVGDNEKAFIKETLDCYRKKDLQTPWRQIIKTSHFWAAVGSHVASNILYVFYLVLAPKWLMLVTRSVESVSSSTPFPFVAMTVTYFVLSPIIDWISNWRYLRLIIDNSLLRKVTNGLGALGIVVGLMTWPNYVDGWNNAAICIFIAILGLLGFQFCGFLSSFKDMSENYSGSLMLISCTVSSVAASAVPFVNGLILADKSSDSNRWRIIKLIVASLYIVSTVVFTLFGSHKRQRWDNVTDKLSFGHQNAGMDINNVQLESYDKAKLTYSHDKQTIDSML